MSGLSTPRVRLTRGDGEFPFVVGVMADLSAHRAGALPPLAERAFVPVDRASLDRRLAQAAPHIALRVPDRLTGGDALFEVELSFLKMTDFEPAAVARQLPMLRRLIEDRKALAESDRELREIDARLSRQLAAVLHHPEFRAIERTWRGIEYLVNCVPPDAAVSIQLLNVNRKTLSHDLAEADGFDQSELFLKVYDEPLSDPEGAPFGLLVSDIEFTRHAGDLDLLRGLAGVAEFSLAPLLAGVAPAIFDGELWARLPGGRELAKQMEGPDFAAWRSFRDGEESRFVGLALPQVLARTHYDPIRQPVGDFDFDEAIDGAGPDHQLWMSGSWAVAARAIATFADAGWFAKLPGRVEGLPGIAVSERGRSQKQHAETTLADATATELMKLGFLPLVERADGLDLIGSATCQKPKQYHDAAVTRHAATGAKLEALLSLTRVALWLKAQARAGTPRTLEAELTKLLTSLVGDDPTRPLREASVQVTKPADAPYPLAKLRLRPHRDSEDPDFFMNLQTELPVRG